MFVEKNQHKTRQSFYGLADLEMRQKVEKPQHKK
jgi:hypothetical protein